MANNVGDNNKTGTSNYYATSSKYNADDYHIRTVIDKLVNTAFIARIDSCSSAGEGGTRTVCATPLICEINGDGDALASPSYIELPHYRFQGGIAAFIVDPVAGDLGVFVCMKRDSSGLNKSSSNTQKPSTFRKFNLADSVMVATIHTKDPTVWIHCKQDNTIIVHAPVGCIIESDGYIKATCATCDITASGGATVTAPNVTINGDLVVNGAISSSGGISSSGDISAGGTISDSSVNLSTHVHTGDSGGTTGTPR